MKGNVRFYPGYLKQNAKQALYGQKAFYVSGTAMRRDNHPDLT